MIISGRQMSIGCADIPKIKYDEKPDVRGYTTIRDVFAKAIFNKMDHNTNPTMRKLLKEERKKEQAQFRDSVEQTLSWLKKMGALKPAKKITSIELWQCAYPMHPFYEGVCCSLEAMQIKKHFPSMSAAMAKGHIMGHYGLTKIKECILYTMEYLQKEDLFVDAKIVASSKKATKWVEDTNMEIVKVAIQGCVGMFKTDSSGKPLTVKKSGNGATITFMKRYIGKKVVVFVIDAPEKEKKKNPIEELKEAKKKIGELV